jgi:hypothetical protein
MDSTGRRKVHPAIVMDQEGFELDITQTRCIEIDFPGKAMGMRHLLRQNTVAGPISWMGSPGAGQPGRQRPVAERNRARRIWNQLGREAEQARRSDDPALKAAGGYLLTMMNRMWADSYLYVITVSDDHGVVAKDGGGLEVPINATDLAGRAHRGRAIIIADGESTRYLNASQWILLAHELGGAYSSVRGGSHGRNAVRAENAARTLVGCHSRNAAHLFDNIPFNWGNPTCRR